MSVVLFVLLPIEAAAIWSLLGGYLLLPSAMSVDIALLPPLDKSSIPAITTFLLCWMKGARSEAPQRSWAIYLCALIFVISPIFTSFGNSYELQIADRSIPGFYALDGIKIALRNLLTLAPFFVGVRFLSSENGQAVLLRALPTAALVYSAPMLFEIRMSPQLHNWVYGFFPHSFAQQVRDGGFRPVVFLGHGLEVALFASMAVVAAVVAARRRWRLLGVPAGVASIYLTGVLLLCKSMASIIYVIVAAPFVIFSSPRTWVNAGLSIVIVVSTYPLLRSDNLIPVHHISAAASKISTDRSASFNTRVENEDRLLEKANEKPFFGWGTWGRNRIYDEESGRDVSVTDGAWIIQFGSFGWVGYLSLFGLFVSSVLRARIGVRGPVTKATITLGGLTLVLAINLLDLLPNADLLPFTYVIAGSIAGCLRAKTIKRPHPRLLTRSRPAAALAD